jgi:CYTH domain-containing protein
MSAQGLEIERKFLLDRIPEDVSSRVLIRQGYIYKGESELRIRVDDKHATLTYKGGRSGATRVEKEIQIPYEDGERMLRDCSDQIIKTRHFVHHGDLLWEVDEFHGEHEGLLLAEVELTSEDQNVEIPEWVGMEVTHDQKYYNSNLACVSAA